MVGNFFKILILEVLGLHCCPWASAVAHELVAVPSLSLEPGLWSSQTSVVATQGLSSCSLVSLWHVESSQTKS